MKIEWRQGFVMLVFGLTGCAGSGPPVQSGMTVCEDPRPQVCTMIYSPVCGIHEDKSQKTYASDCTACSKATVVGYELGECSS
jgi:hypothetical protein